MTQTDSIGQIASGVLDRQLDPVVRYRLMRDVMELNSSLPAVNQARRQAMASKWVRILWEEQHPDGGWGRFHTADTRDKRRLPTTEFAVSRALALGRDRSDRGLVKTVRYLERVLAGKARFPDPAEGGRRWRAGVRVFTAGTLALIQPDSLRLDEEYKVWAEIACRTFANGQYDPQAERLAHRELTGVSGDLRYLRLGNRYALSILGARASKLPEPIEQAMVERVWEMGIGYLDAPIPPQSRYSGGLLGRWFASHELMSRFPSWRRLAGPVVEWLWSERGEDGLWDFGPGSGVSSYWPLSDDWRLPERRKHDYTVRTLVLLKRLCGVR